MEEESTGWRNLQGRRIHSEEETTEREKSTWRKKPEEVSRLCEDFPKTVFAHVFNNVDYWIPFEFFLSFVRWFFFFLVTCNLEC